MSLPTGIPSESKGWKVSFHRCSGRDQIEVCGTQVNGVLSEWLGSVTFLMELQKSLRNPTTHPMYLCPERGGVLPTTPRDLPGPGQREPLLQKVLGFSNFK